MLARCNVSLSLPASEYQTEVNVFFAILMCALSVLTAVGNTVLLIIIFKTSALRTVTNSLIVSLAISDLLVGFLIMPFFASARFHGGWYFNDAFCQATGFLNCLCSSATVLNLMMVSIDRCIAVTWPLKYGILITAPSIGAMLTYVWTHSTVFALTPLIGWGRYSYTKGHSTCMLDIHENIDFILTRTAFCTVIPGCIMAAMLILILKSAHAQRRVFAVMPVAVGLTLAVHQPTTNYRRTTLQAMRTLFLIILALIMLWVPHFILTLSEYGSPGSIPPLYFLLATWLTFISSAVNPMIFLTNKKFKQRIREVLCSWRRQGQGAGVSQGSAGGQPPSLPEQTQNTLSTTVFSQATAAESPEKTHRKNIAVAPRTSTVTEESPAVAAAAAAGPSSSYQPL